MRLILRAFLSTLIVNAVSFNQHWPLLATITTLLFLLGTVLYVFGSIQEWLMPKPEQPQQPTETMTRQQAEQLAHYCRDRGAKVVVNPQPNRRATIDINGQPFGNKVQAWKFLASLADFSQ